MSVPCFRLEQATVERLIGRLHGATADVLDALTSLDAAGEIECQAVLDLTRALAKIHEAASWFESETSGQKTDGGAS